MKKIMMLFSLFIMMAFTLISCGNDNKGQLNIDSFDYNIVSNGSTIYNEYLYGLSFEMSLSYNKHSSIKDFDVRIEGKKTVQFEIADSNSENTNIANNDYHYPCTSLNYSIAKKTTSTKVTATLNITSIELIDDINSFLKLYLVVEGGEIADQNNFTEDGCFKLDYSNGTSPSILQYELNEDKESYKLVSASTQAKSLEIPAFYQNYPVNEIADGAFRGLSSIEKLILPTTISSLQKGLLKDMKNIKALTIPFLGGKPEALVSSGAVDQYTLEYLFGNSLLSIQNGIKEVVITGGTYIGANAFKACVNLQSVSIPKSVTIIGMAAFLSCYNLVEIYNYSALEFTIGSLENGEVAKYAKVIHTKEEPSNRIKTKDGYIFIKDNEEKYYLISYEGPETNLTLPNDINGHSYDINDYALYQCRSITSLVIPNGVSVIGKSAFCFCSNLTDVTLPNSVISIGESAFSGCSNLKNIQLPEGLKTIESAIFYYCSNLVNVIIPQEVTSIDGFAFSYCSSLKNVQLPNGLKLIEMATFQYCDNLNGIILPQGITSIAEYAFHGCMSLTDIYYLGTQVEWESISIGDFNENLLMATIYFYSETKPTISGNYWHYLNGEATRWE